MTDANITTAEADAIKALGLTWPRPKPAAPFPRADTSRHRRPLGLRPVPDAPGDSDRDLSSYGDDELTHGPVVDIAAIDKDLLNSPVNVHLLYTTLNAAGSISDTVNARAKEREAALQTKIVGLETEIAKLTAKLAEATAKVGELAFVSERLRIENKGPPGVKGDRGRDGHDGPRGETGLRGEKGERGAPAPVIVGWDVREETYEIAPLLSDGSRGAVVRLRPLFEMYDGQAAAADALEEADAAAASREAIKRQTEAGWSR